MSVPYSQSDPSSAHSIELLARHHYRWNAAIGYAHGVLEGMASACFAWSTVVTWFVSEVTTSKLVIGIGTSLVTLGMFCPQVFSAYWIESRERVKRYVVASALLYVGFGLALAGIAFAPNGQYAWLWVTGVLFSVFGQMVASGLGAPAGITLVGKIMPQNRRGGFMGRRAAIFTGGATAGGLVVAAVLGHLPHPVNYAACFIAGSILHFAGTLVFALTREFPAQAVQRPRRFLEYTKQLPQIVRQDRQFAWFLGPRLLLAMANVAFFSYLAVYARESLKLHNAPQAAGLFGALFSLASCAGYLVWGWMGDRVGFRRVIILCAALHVVRVAVVLAWPNTATVCTSFILSGLCLSAMICASQNLILDFAAPAQRPVYIAITNGMRWPFLLLAAMVSGWLADATSYAVVFALSALLGLASLAGFWFRMIEPRHHRPHTQVAPGI